MVVCWLGSLGLGDDPSPTCIFGAFLPVLAGLIPFLTGTVLPALEVEALSGLASTGVQKLNGNGLYLKKGSGVCRIETDGEGLYLGPVSGKGFETVGNYLYLMKNVGCLMVED